VSSDELIEVKAPISGIFYRAPAPGTPRFVEIGVAVRKGQVLALLEAMKLFSKIKAPADGIVREIVGVNAEAVATGQILFVLQRTAAA
jgi:acetyl-CoA carboxylase biotin carboxyl carrier protein